MRGRLAFALVAGAVVLVGCGSAKRNAVVAHAGATVAGFLLPFAPVVLAGWWGVRRRILRRVSPGKATSAFEG